MKRLGSYIILNEQEAKQFVATALRWLLTEYNEDGSRFWEQGLPSSFNIDSYVGKLWYEVLEGDGYERFLRFLEGPS